MMPPDTVSGVSFDGTPLNGPHRGRTDMGSTHPRPKRVGREEVGSLGPPPPRKSDDLGLKNLFLFILNTKFEHSHIRTNPTTPPKSSTSDPGGTVRDDPRGPDERNGDRLGVSKSLSLCPRV